MSVAQLSSLGVNPQVSGSTPITVQLHQAGQGGAKVSLPFGFGRLVQTASGQHLLLTSTPPQQRTVGPDGSVISTAQGTPVVLTTPNSQAGMKLEPLTLLIEFFALVFTKRLSVKLSCSIVSSD